MIPLCRAIGRGSQVGHPLPAPYKVLDQAKIYFKRSSLVMIAGAPGSFKTGFTLNLVDLMKVPTLYFSNDSDEHVMASRMMARRSGLTTDQTAQRIERHPEGAIAALAEVDHIQWSFDSSPTPDDIDDEVYAYAELYGQFPELIVVDILMKVQYDAGDEHSSLGKIVGYLDNLARETGACVIVVHHTSESVQGEPCPPRSALLQKVAQLPGLILTVAKNGGLFYVAAVKNRFGPDDYTGKTALQFYIAPESCLITEGS